MMGFPGWMALGFKSYQDYLQSDYWKKKRDWILEAKGNCCEVCGSHNNLEVHHKDYSSVGNENQHDVQVLCKTHHQEAHNG